ncbi:hypothetical protein GRI62_08640 [Erythrobacter arachoides]|uniref:Cytochrome c domain-containing protein n=1 Tax=Aurantiacibacter arachoides TaxID=1850444 RepID=A0A844ZZQ4_9SPHN|nr:hypothetical protein [Aurantiacibacter arachoides]MXO93673.1 hypothetical protein [Aurantiacibacter arachoides]GGD47565.1 hypothetical protein GCM10011411_04100 [Aurantiacibacter arachoides]
MKPDIVILALLPLALAACSGPAPDLPYGPPQQLMAAHVEPYAQTYWQSVKFESELMPDGTVENREYEPDSDAEWEEVRAAAAHLREMSDVLESPAYAEGRGPAWMTYAAGLGEAALAAEQAAQARDPDAVFTAGGNLYNVCRACHQTYPPAELEAEGGTVDDVPQG